MNIAVATLAIGDVFTKSMQPGLTSKVEYCEQHGYDFVLGGEEVHDKERPPAWSKINLVRKILGDYDVVFLSDADVVITNPLVKLEYFIEQLIPIKCEVDKTNLIFNRDHTQSKGEVIFTTALDKLVLIARDKMNLCTGNMFFRNDPMTLDLLEEIYAQTQFIEDKWWEQRAFIYLYNKHQYVKDMTQVVGPRMFNTYEELWQPGSFLIHFAGMLSKLIPAKMRQYRLLSKALPDVLLRQLHEQRSYL